jgi:branched-chain amino acid transport system ATP-binding protein
MTEQIGPFALELVQLKKFFAALPVTQNVSIAVRPGERRLLLGPNGAGKTTLFNLITGEILPNSGEIKLFGQDVTRMKPHQRAHLGLSRTYQIITLFPKDTLLHNIALGLLGLMQARWNIFKPMSRDIMIEAERVLGLVGLDHLAHRPISEIAYGEKRRAEIAMALAQKPKILLLDEPLAGLSSAERTTIKKLIASIPRETSVVMIEHDMDTALDLAETITLLHYGKVIVDGPRDAVIADERAREVYLGH